MKENIQEIFKKYDVEGYINISEVNLSMLDYTPLHDEISIDNTKTYDTNITIIKDNKKVGLSFDGFSIEKMEEFIKKGITLLEYAQKDDDIELPKHSSDIEKDFGGDCIAGVDFLKGQLDFFLNYKFNFAKVEEFSASYKTSSHTYIDSNGVKRFQKSQSYICFYGVFGEKGDQKDSTYDYKVSSDKVKPILKEDLEKLDKKIQDKLYHEKGLVKTGNYNVTLDKKVVSSFVGILMNSFSAESMREGLSMFSKNNIGDKILSDKLTIKSICDLKGGIGNSLFNGEGFKQSDKTIIENGILKNKFYDYKNAKKEGIDDFISSSSNLCFFGDSTHNFLDNSDFLFTNLMAFHSVENSTGKFALNGEGYFIKDGKKVAFVKDIALRGDIKTLFNSIISVGNDFDEQSSNMCPSITFENQSVVV